MAPSLTLPPPATLSTLPDSELEHILDLLFEPSPELHQHCIQTLRASWNSYSQAIDAITAHLHSMLTNSSTSSDAKTQLYKILGSHPRLGEKKVDSAQSAVEQAQLQAGGNNNGEAEKLAALNKEYEDKFPGLRYVVFVNGRSRDVIMEDMRRRIDAGDIKQEELTTIESMGVIAKDRAKKLQATQS